MSLHDTFLKNIQDRIFYLCLQILSRKSREGKCSRAVNITSAVASTIAGATADGNTLFIYLRDLASHPIQMDKETWGRRKLNTAV